MASAAQSVNIKITGPVGSGKTTVAAIIMAELKKYGFSVASDEQPMRVRFRYVGRLARPPLEVCSRSEVRG